MRISQNEILKIKNVLTEFQLLPSCKTFLFGSRLYDYKKGGDIDLILLCPESILNSDPFLMSVKAELKDL